MERVDTPEPLPLDDARWRTLSYAHGPDGTPVARWLRSFLAHPVPPPGSGAPFARLWDGLCHQGSTYEASYVAVPHIVGACVRMEPEIRMHVLHLVGTIAAFQPLGAPMPTYLARAWRASLRHAALMAEGTLLDEPYPPLTLLTDLAACSGRTDVARALLQMELGELEVACACGRREVLGVSEHGLDVSPLRWRRRGPGAMGELAALGKRVRVECAAAVEDLGGVLACPACDADIELLRDAIT